MGLTDPWTAYQVDMAIAIKEDRQEKEIHAKTVEAIRGDMVNIMRALGAKVRTRPQSNPSPPSHQDDEIPPLKEVLAALGGKGTVIKYNKRDGRS